MVVVDTQVQKQKAPFSSIPARPIYGPRTRELIDQGILEEFPVQIVELLLEIPAYGLSFLEDFLAIAQIEPETDKDRWRFAFCCVQNVRELAQLMGWGYDTAHKYVILFSALGLLQKYRYQHKVILQFPLRGYIFPDSFEELDKLIDKSRSRVQLLAARVKARCLELQMIQPTPVCSQTLDPQKTLLPSVKVPDSNLNTTLAQTDTNTQKQRNAKADKTKTDDAGLQNLQSHPHDGPGEVALLQEMHEYTAECAREQRQSTVAHPSDLFAAFVTQFLLNDRASYEKYAPLLQAGEILHISIIRDQKDKSAENETLATCDIYPQYFEPGFPINRYAWEYLGYNPKFESAMFCNNRHTYHLDFFEISSHYTPTTPCLSDETDSIPTHPQETSLALSSAETEPSNDVTEHAAISPPTSFHEDVLYEEISLPASMPKLRERWLAEGRIVERPDDNGVLKTYKVCREQTNQNEFMQQAEALSLQQIYSQEKEQATTPLRYKRRKRQIYNSEYFQTEENEQTSQIIPPEPTVEMTNQVEQQEQSEITAPFSQPAVLTPIANHLSSIAQTIQNQREARRLEQKPLTLDKQESASQQQNFSLSSHPSESTRPISLTPVIQPSEQVASTVGEAMEEGVSLPEHLIPLEYWDKEAIAECERTFKAVPGDKLDFSYDDLHYYQTVYKNFPSAETFLEVDAYRDWHIADFGEDFLQELNTLNVITLIKYIINNKNNIQKRNTLITFFVSVFDKKSLQKEKSAGYYQQLFKNNYHPDVISCAFLTTVLAMYSKGRETIERPGAIFIKNCQTLQKKVNEEGCIPYSDLKAARRFGNFTCVDLAVALHDNLVLDGATEMLSVYLGVTFATNACYRSQNNAETPLSSQQDKPKQKNYPVSNLVRNQTEAPTSERRVS